MKKGTKVPYIFYEKVLTFFSIRAIIYLTTGGQPLREERATYGAIHTGATATGLCQPRVSTSRANNRAT